MKAEVLCDWCGKKVLKYPSQIKRHNFCSRSCLAAYSSKTDNPNGYDSLKDYSNMSRNMSSINRRLNPERMAHETREKLRESRLNTGSGSSYAKFFGRHEHRVVAEQMLGRKLLPEEVVHHIDGNKRNNDPKNLLVLSSQAEHARLHMKKGGDER